jgi:hypothetical protein
MARRTAWTRALASAHAGIRKLRSHFAPRLPQTVQTKSGSISDSLTWSGQRSALMAPRRPRHRVSREAGRAKKNRRQGQALDHENRKTPISKPAANAQRPNVQAETTRTRLRWSCGISWDRSVIAGTPLQCCDGSGLKKAAPALGAGGNCWGRPYGRGSSPAMVPS